MGFGSEAVEIAVAPTAAVSGAAGSPGRSMATSGARPTAWPPRLVGGGSVRCPRRRGGAGWARGTAAWCGHGCAGGAPCGLWAQIDRAPPWCGKRGFGDPRGYVDPLHGERGPQPVGMAPLPHPFYGASAQGCGWGLRPASGTPATRPCWGSPRLPVTLHPFVRGGSICWAAPSPLIDAVSPGGSPGPINRACVRRAVPRRSTMAGHSARPTALGHLPTPSSSGQTPLTPPSPLCDIARTPVDGRFPRPPLSCCSRGAASPHPIARSQRCDPALPSPPPGGRGGGMLWVPPPCRATGVAASCLCPPRTRLWRGCERPAQGTGGAVGAAAAETCPRDSGARIFIVRQCGSSAAIIAARQSVWIR